MAWHISRSRASYGAHSQPPAGLRENQPARSATLGAGAFGAGCGLGGGNSAAFGAGGFRRTVFGVVVYTIWLKRRTCWSIVWGGISGGMPILAGRALATGQIDLVGIFLTMAVLFWIPTHILTFSMRYFADYCAAKVPTFASTYGFDTTRAVIAFAAILAVVSIGTAGVMIGVQAGFLRLMAVLSTGLLLLSFATVWRPSEQVNFGLFKYASLYMLASMILLSI
jgi:protoheme IX farnesyltransferase